MVSGLFIMSYRALACAAVLCKHHASDAHGLDRGVLWRWGGVVVKGIDTKWVVVVDNDVCCCGVVGFIGKKL